MERKVAKELLHVKGWLARVAEIVERGRSDYLDDALIQEAGDSKNWSRPPRGSARAAGADEGCREPWTAAACRQASTFARSARIVALVGSSSAVRVQATGCMLAPSSYAGF